MPGEGDVAPVRSNLQTVRTPRMALNKQTHLVAQMSLLMINYYVPSSSV